MTQDPVRPMGDVDTGEDGAGPRAPHAGYFTDPLGASDPELAGLIESELARQRAQVELIASENIVSRAVLEAQGSVLTNKTVEGYPGARYHGGAEFADAVGARLLVDMAHISGLVAGGVHPSPLPHAHITTTTTYKSLRGARGGVILTDDEALAKKINSALFPGVQGSPLLHAMAGKAACLGEALRPEFKAYARAMRDNAHVLAETLMGRGLTLVSGGTDTSLLLVDLRPRGLTGRVASDRLEAAGLTANKNGVPDDPQKPMITSGLRLSSNAGTTRGFGAEEFRLIGTLIADVLDELADAPDGPAPALAAAREQVAALCRRFPIYPDL